MPDLIDGETGEVIEATALARREAPPPPVHGEMALGGLTASSPTEIVERAASVAAALQDVIEQQKLYELVGKDKRKHITIDGWNVLGSLACVHTRERHVARLPDGTWEAHVEVVAIRGGVERVIGEASGMCSPTEPRQSGAAQFQLRSMAITRARSRAYRACLGWVVSMAGYVPDGPESLADSAEPTRAARPTATPAAKRAPFDRARTVQAFARIGVTSDELDSWGGGTLADLEVGQQDELRRIYAAIVAAPEAERERVIREYFPAF
ncbi:MAG: hypothetical protein KF847_19865 [Pirellulales bacterium]|nr:hypothetical protein [Pirellulales bacterium]